MENNIPKLIHYCWFGKNEKPEIVNRCIESWHKNLIGYKIIEWNEDNFDINKNLYIKEAYEAKKYAFVSDYVRVFVLYNYGGVYLDTDVEVFKSFDDLLDNDSFWGFEQENYIATSTIGAKKENKIIKDFLLSYNSRTFYKNDGSFDELTNVAIITELLKNYGLVQNGKYQKIKELATFYPQEYFSPYDYINCRNFKNDNTYCIHHFYKSWLPRSSKIKGKIKKILANIIGGENILRIRKKFSE